ncbi:hypothetical protein ACIA5C_41760 [Actinoplanes sp. NPDC051343]|uniref:hypothetical protein n=1 Tax=Actinoplanes sp. NPDC051343 TaxID=3363906 RepID=UPI0037B5B164
MSTGLVARPAPGTRDAIAPVSGTPAAVTASGRGPLRRVAALRRTSPGRLQLILSVLLVLGVLAGLVAGLTARSARSGTDDLGNRAQPLLVQAETIYSALADADTTAAQAFLAGGLEPVALTRRYEDDLSRATTALTAAARLTPDGSKSAGAVAALASGVAQYSALVATARADNRQGLPVGSSYLSAASQLNRDTLLKQADALFGVAQSEVSDGYGNARSIVWVVLFTLLVLVLLAGLLLAQRYLSRATHRTFNLPLLAATGLTVLLGLGAAGVLISQNVHLHRAGEQGSTPAAQLAEARILALQERGDEALELAAHGSGSVYETDFGQAQKQLTAAHGPLTSDFLANEAVIAHETYLNQHKQVRQLDDGGNYDGAVQLAIGPDTTKAFDTVTTDIGTALDERKAAFTAEIDSAGNGLGLLTVLGPLVALAVCALAFVGIRARLEEYR